MIHPECIKCLNLQADKLLNKYHIDEVTAREITDLFRRFIDGSKESSQNVPEAACFLHRLIKKRTNNDDLYKKEKAFYNQLMLRFEEGIRGIIRKSENPFQTALRYALAGNIIDFGPPKHFDVMQVLSEAASIVPAIDHSELLFEELAKASTVLYLGDNAGEIVLDKLFIETINHPNLWFAVRGGNIINDVTLEDVYKTGMDQVSKCISNGYDAPSTIIDQCSPEFKMIFKKADVVISKGQGNLEGLIHNRDKKIFFLLMVKCQVIGEVLNVAEKNSAVFFNQIITRP